MAKEIERKFMVLSNAWRSHSDEGTRLRQAYIAVMDDRSVRVRIFNNLSARLTIKVGKSAMVRDEFEYDLPLADAVDLFSQAIGHVVEKTRYRVPHAGFTWEVDVFEGALKGLVLAEVEMRQTTDRPSLPPWLGRELTGDHAFSNQHLAIHGVPELAD